MILITGGTGFIGRQAVSDLLEEGYSVRLLVRDTELAKTLFPKADIVKGDISDKNSLQKATKNVASVIHLAGVISYTLSKEELFKINFLGTKNLLEAFKGDKFLFSSSVSVYGETKGKADESTPPNPRNFYGESKLAAEKAVLESPVPSVAYRISVVYGINSPIWNEIMKFFSKGFPIPNARVLTNLVHVSDVSRAFLIGLKKGTGAYNIVGDTIPFPELARLFCNEFGIKPKFWPVWLVRLLATLAGKGKDMQAFIVNRDYSGEKAKKELGFSPKANLQKEIKNMIEAFKKRKPVVDKKPSNDAL